MIIAWHKPAQVRRFTALLIGVILLAACQSGPVILVATPIPPDSAFHTYRHPSGAFTIRLPADWSVRDVSQPDAVRVEFSPPSNDGLPLTVYVINTGTVLNTASLLDAITTYQARVNGDSSVYHELTRNAQGDGSWRLAGIRQTSIGPRQLNTFMQADKSFLSAIVADITGADETRLALLHTVINTYRADPSAALAANSMPRGTSNGTPDSTNDSTNGSVNGSEAAVNVNTSSGTVTFRGMFTWTDSTGAFNINGELSNVSGSPLEAVRVTALLYDAQNGVLGEEGDVIASKVVEANQTAPFSIHFRNGKPPQAVRYELQASARNADYNLSTYLGPDSFLKGNELASYNQSGYFVVSGDVVNKTQQAAHGIRVTVVVYDEQQRVVDSQSEFVEKPDLLPGESSHYAVTFYQLAGNAARFATEIEGQTTASQ